MQRAARGIMAWGYYYSLAIGLLPIAYDARTGRASTTTIRTLYTLVANAVVVLLVALYFRSELLMTGSSIGGESVYLHHHHIYTLMVTTRATAVLVTLTLNWRRRAHIQQLLQDFAQLWRVYFQRLLSDSNKAAQCHFERALLWKFCSSTYAPLAMWSLMAAVVDSELLLKTASVLLLLNILDWIMNQYYFAVLNANFSYGLLEYELRRICNAMQVTAVAVGKVGPTKFSSGGGGAFVTQCCLLADQLDALALAHRTLHNFALRCNSLYQWQGTAVLLNLYLNNILLIYYGFVWARSSSSSEIGSVVRGLGVLFLLGSTVLAYYTDFIVFLSAIIEMLSFRERSVELIRRQLPLCRLDVRLEESCERFSLQLALLPLEVELIGLVKLNKPTLLAIFASTITHSIFLMQYDYKNF